MQENLRDSAGSITSPHDTMPAVRLHQVLSSRNSPSGDISDPRISSPTHTDTAEQILLDGDPDEQHLRRSLLTRNERRPAVSLKFQNSQFASCCLVPGLPQLSRRLPDAP